MKLFPKPVRILAMDLHPNRFGFAAMELPEGLLDWGVRIIRRRGLEAPQRVLAKRLTRLLGLWRPSLVVVKVCSRAVSRKSLSRIAVLAQRQGASCRQIQPSDIRKVFLAQQCATRYAIASLLAERFPALRWQLPEEKRHFAHSEYYHMCMFDAVSAALAFAPRQTARSPQLGGRKHANRSGSFRIRQ